MKKIIFCALSLWAVVSSAADVAALPLMIGGESHNSAAHDARYFERVCAKFAAMNANFVLAPIAWCDFEPEEGTFDPRPLKQMLAAARRHKLKLGILWFGTWKNGESSYAPVWMRADTNRFPWAMRKDRSNVAGLGPNRKVLISVFSEAARAADARAFAKLMTFLKEFDGNKKTVPLIQIENEVGIHLSDRDYSAVGEAAWKARGEADKNIDPEVFMARAYAQYLDAVAAAGKAVYDLPIYANAWLPNMGCENKPAAVTGYPVGGPVPRVLDVWKAAAPHIDFLAPDLYRGDFKRFSKLYARKDNPLFIPESPRSGDMIGKAYWTIGALSGLGYCPFGLETVAAEHPLAQAYGYLRALSPLIIRARGTSRLHATYLESTETAVDEIFAFDGFKLRVQIAPVKKEEMPRAGRGAVLAVQDSSDTLYVLGHSFMLHPVDCEYAKIEVGTFSGHTFKVLTELNGDETHHNNAVYHPLGHGLFLPETGLNASMQDMLLFRVRVFKPGEHQPPAGK